MPRHRSGRPRRDGESMLSRKADDLIFALGQHVAFTETGVVVRDESSLDEAVMRRVARGAASEDGEVREVSVWLAWSIAQSLGFGPADGRGLAEAIRRDDVYSLRVPWFTTSRELFDETRAALAACLDLGIGVVGLSVLDEQVTNEESSVAGFLAAAVATGWRFPLLLDNSLSASEVDGLSIEQMDIRGANPTTGLRDITDDLQAMGIMDTVAVLRRHLIPRPQPRPCPLSIAQLLQLTKDVPVK